jgi:hypothetical protein
MTYPLSSFRGPSDRIKGLFVNEILHAALVYALAIVAGMLIGFVSYRIGYPLVTYEAPLTRESPNPVTPAPQIRSEPTDAPTVVRPEQPSTPRPDPIVATVRDFRATRIADGIDVSFIIRNDSEFPLEVAVQTGDTLIYDPRIGKEWPIQSVTGLTYCDTRAGCSPQGGGDPSVTIIEPKTTRMGVLTSNGRDDLPSVGGTISLKLYLMVRERNPAQPEMSDARRWVLNAFWEPNLTVQAR